MKKEKKEENYLDYIPEKSPNCKWVDKEDGIVQIIVDRDSLFERIVRKLFFTPESYKVDLDRIGSFIWNRIDGKRNLYDIGQLLKVEFGEDIEPLYERLIQYINILKNNKFIKL
jgi:coenzyme PQQ synthesis protein D (PqqD)